MRIIKIKIENYRLLKFFSIDIEESLSLVVGKNNTGKTSLLSILNKFLNQSANTKFQFNDINLDTKKEIEKNVSDNTIDEDDYIPIGIKLRIFIEYTPMCNTANISRIMMDLDPENNYVVLGFDYVLTYEKYIKLQSDFCEFKIREINKVELNQGYKIKNVSDFLNINHSNYFQILRKSIAIDKDTLELDETNYIDLDDQKIGLNEIINFKYISAKRDVANKDVDKTLSIQTSKIYDTTENSPEQNQAVDDFKDRLGETDDKLSNIYSTLFNKVINKVSQFGGLSPNDSNIKIISTLQHRELLKGNTTVVYKHGENNELPENYNGLGYMNLISMIFEMEIIIHEFKREKERSAADINLLFIEEPEAHTHPQMQYVFIKNIKSILQDGILRADGTRKMLQYIITTHSSHIVADSDFNDLKYIKKNDQNSVIAKNIKDLESEYKNDQEENNYRFLKQYLTLNRSELFFADKAVFIEGDTERILLPAMMKKMDNVNSSIEGYKPLLSQNISIVDVGAYSHIFEKFIDFIGLRKILIITDIDSYYKEPKMDADGINILNIDGTEKQKTIKCVPSNVKATNTSNASLIFFHKKNTEDSSLIDYYNKLTFDWKILRRNKDKHWVSNRKSNLLICYQIEENNYIGRSFEDAFFKCNKDFIISEENKFASLKIKYLNQYKSNTIDEFVFAEKGIDSKPSLAIEILLNSNTTIEGHEYDNWNVPLYIKEGLEWLQRD